MIIYARNERVENIKIRRKELAMLAPDNNNNNVNAFLTCTTQEAPLGSYNSAVNLFSPFSTLSWYLETPPCLRSPFRFGLSLSFLYGARCSLQREKARSFSTCDGHANTRARIVRTRGDVTSKWNGHGFARAEENALSLLCPISRPVIHIYWGINRNTTRARTLYFVSAPLSSSSSIGH